MMNDMVIIIIVALFLMFLNTSICWILTQEKGKRKKRIFISIGIQTFIISTIFFIIFIVPIIKEANAWNHANKIDTLESYNHYLLKYPETKRARFDSKDSITMQELSKYFSNNFLESLNIANYYTDSWNYVYSENFNNNFNDWYEWDTKSGKAVVIGEKAIVECEEADSTIFIYNYLLKRLKSYMFKFEMEIINSAINSKSGIAIIGEFDGDSSFMSIDISETDLYIRIDEIQSSETKEYKFLHSIKTKEPIIVEVFVLGDRIKIFINSNFIAEVEDYRNNGVTWFYFVTQGIAKTHFDDLTIHQLWLKN